MAPVKKSRTTIAPKIKAFLKLGLSMSLISDQSDAIINGKAVITEIWPAKR